MGTAGTLTRDLEKVFPFNSKSIPHFNFDRFSSPWMLPLLYRNLPHMQVAIGMEEDKSALLCITWRLKGSAIPGTTGDLLTCLDSPWQALSNGVSPSLEGLILATPGSLVNCLYWMGTYRWQSARKLKKCYLYNGKSIPHLNLDIFSSPWMLPLLHRNLPHFSPVTWSNLAISHLGSQWVYRAMRDIFVIPGAPCMHPLPLWALLGP